MTEFKILEAAILDAISGATKVYVEGEHVFVEENGAVVRYLLSPEAQRIVLLEREGRPLDIRLGEVTLLVPIEGAE